MECSLEFAVERSGMLRRWYGDEQPNMYTWSNFAYGQVYYTGWRQLMKRPQVHAAMLGAARDGLDFIMLGANVGTELFYAGLTYGAVTRTAGRPRSQRTIHRTSAPSRQTYDQHITPSCTTCPASARPRRHERGWI